jgi:hypothetical protein
VLIEDDDLGAQADGRRFRRDPGPVTVVGNDLEVERSLEEASGGGGIANGQRHCGDLDGRLGTGPAEASHLD